MRKDMYSELEIPAFLRRKYTGKKVKVHVTAREPAPLKMRLDVPEHKIEVVKSNPAPINVKARIERRARQVIAEIDEVFEQEVWFDPKFKLNPDAPYKFLHANNVSAVVASKVGEHFNGILEEYDLIKTDPQTKEGYARYTRKEIARFREFYTAVVNACENFVSNQKKMKVRKPRKKRAVSPEKKLAKFKYCKMRGQLASVNPANVLGAQQVFLFDTKYSKITMLDARSREGLDIKGQTFQGVDYDVSLTKRVRQTILQETIEFLLKATKPQCKKLLRTLRTKPGKLQTRSSNEMIILRVF